MVDSYTILQSSEFLGRTGQLIVVEVKVQQLGQPPNLGRNGACQRIFSHKTLVGILVYQSNNMSRKVLTGQLVAVQAEVRHASAEPELSRDVACAARRSFLGRGILVYQTGQDEHKIDVPVKLLYMKLSSFMAVQVPSSVGIRPGK